MDCSEGNSIDKNKNKIDFVYLHSLIIKKFI